MAGICEVSDLNAYLVTPKYLQKIMKPRVNNSKYKDLTPEERTQMYKIKREEWCSRNRDRIEAYGRGFCPMCRTDHTNLYKHMQTKGHIARAAEYEKSRESLSKANEQLSEKRDNNDIDGAELRRILIKKMI